MYYLKSGDIEVQNEELSVNPTLEDIKKAVFSPNELNFVACCLALKHGERFKISRIDAEILFFSLCVNFYTSFKISDYSEAKEYYLKSKGNYLEYLEPRDFIIKKYTQKTYVEFIIPINRFTIKDRNFIASSTHPTRMKINDDIMFIDSILPKNIETDSYLWLDESDIPDIDEEKVKNIFLSLNFKICPKFSKTNFENKIFFKNNNKLYFKYKTPQKENLYNWEEAEGDSFVYMPEKSYIIWGSPPVCKILLY